MKPRKQIAAHGLVLLIYAALYCVLTWPAVVSFGTHYLCDGGDGLQNIWNIWWVDKAVRELRNPWFTEWLFAPEGITLVGATLNPFNGFVAIPLGLVFDQVVTFNLIIIGSFVATGWFSFLLIRDLGPSFWPAVFGGAAFSFSSFHLAHATGHVQLVALEWLPFFFWAWLRLLREPSHRRALLAAVGLLLVLLCDYYYFFYCVLGGAIVALCQPRLLLQAWKPLATFGVASLILCGPLPLALWITSASDPLAGVHDADVVLNDALGAFVPGSNWRFRELTEWFWGSIESGEVRSEFTNNMTLTVMLAACFAFRGNWRRIWIWCVVGVVFYLLSLGPVLHVCGVEYAGVPMPYAMLVKAFPPLAMTGVPVRFAVMYLLAAAIVASFGVGVVFADGRRRALMLAFVALFVVESLPLVQPTVQPAVPRVVKRLAELPEGSVAGWPWHESRNLFLQTVHGKPMEHGYVARYPGRVYEYGKRMVALAAAGQYDELMRTTKARYLVRRRSDPPPDPQRFAQIYSDEEFVLWVKADDPLTKAHDARAPCGGAPRVETAVLRRVDEVPSAVTIDAAGDARRPFACFFSLSRAPAIVLPNGERFALGADVALIASTVPDNPVFFGNWGVLDEHGRNRVGIHPSVFDVLALPRLWCSVVVFDGAGSNEPCRISEPLLIERTR